MIYARRVAAATLALCLLFRPACGIAEEGVGRVLDVALPPDIPARALLHADAAMKLRLDRLVHDRIGETRDKTDRDARGDAVIVFADPAGDPILPDLGAARAARTGGLAPRATSTNELRFTFESPAYPWTSDELRGLASALDAFYPLGKVVYGSPAFDITVNVRRDPTIGMAGTYNATLNEITLPDASDPTSLCHEMLHAFRDDDVLRLSSFEEGMVRAAEVEIFGRLAPAYSHWDLHHGYVYDVYYETLDRPVVGGQGGNFAVDGYVSTLLRYQLAGYGWAKALLENPRFLQDFNASVYASTLRDSTIPGAESQLVALASAAQGTVEGKPFLVWYAAQGIFNSDPPKGYLLYQRVNQSMVDFFFRDASGRETMQLDQPIEWALYGAGAAVLGTVRAVTSDHGFVDFLPAASALTEGYSGRIEAVASAATPLGMVTDTALTTSGPASGVFGVVANGDSGIVTVVPLDRAVPPVTVPVVNGAFAIPSLESAAGRLAAVFVAPNGRRLSREFTKDASGYFVRMAPTDGTTALAITATAGKRVAKRGSHIRYTILVKNDGPDDASDVVVIDALPAGSGILAISSPGVCAGPETEVGGTVTCALGWLAHGDCATIIVDTTVTVAAKTVLTNVVSVSMSTSNLDEDDDVARTRTKVVGPTAPRVTR